MRTRLDLPLKFLMGVALLSAVPTLAAAQEQEDSNQQAQRSQQNGDQEQKDQEKKSEARTLQAFDLEHVKPQEMVTLIQTISARQHQAEMNRKAKEHAKKQTRDPDDRGATVPDELPTVPPQRTQVQFRPTAGMAQQNRLAVAVDEQTRTLFVRGTEEQVSSVEKLVETFDTKSADLKKQEIDGITIVPVKHDRLQQINTILNQLQLQTQALRVGDTAVLILPDDEEQAKHAEEVIAKLKEDGSDSQQNDQQNDSDN